MYNANTNDDNDTDLSSLLMLLLLSLTVITWARKSGTSCWLERGLCCPTECRQTPAQDPRCKDVVQYTPGVHHNPTVNSTNLQSHTGFIDCLSVWTVCLPCMCLHTGISDM